LFLATSYYYCFWFCTCDKLSVVFGRMLPYRMISTHYAFVHLIAICSYKKLRYRTWSARRAMLVNSCYVSRAIGVIKVSNSKC